MLPPRVRLIVLNFNGGAWLDRCVRHLEALDWPDDRLELVVVDNCSSDGSDVALARDHPRVRVTRNATNTGFPANNLALRELDGIDYVGLVNNDAFVEPDMLWPLVSALEDDPELGAACPRIVLEPRFSTLRITGPVWSAPGDGRALSVRLEGIEADGQDVFDTAVYGSGCFHAERGDGGAFRWLSSDSEVHVPVPVGAAAPRLSVRLGSDRVVEVTLDAGGGPKTVTVGPQSEVIDLDLTGPVYDIVNNVGSVLVDGGFGGDRGFLEPDLGQYDQPEDVFAWCGAGVLFRPAYLREVGLFDERFFMYYEDTDLAWRGRARGWRYRYIPEARMRHLHAATSGEWSPQFRFWVERNRLYLLTKNAPVRLATRAVLRLARDTAVALARGSVGAVARGRRPALGPARPQLRALGSYLWHAPAMVRDRRGLRRAQTVPDAELLAWAVLR